MDYFKVLYRYCDRIRLRNITDKTTSGRDDLKAKGPVMFRVSQISQIEIYTQNK